MEWMTGREPFTTGYNSSEVRIRQQKEGGMKLSKRVRSGFLLIGAILVAAIFSACGGSGGGSSGGAAPASGSVAVMLTDGPYDGLEALYITITKVSLLRADGAEVVVFDDLRGHEVDILQYQDSEYLLTVNNEVPVGTYSKVRLEVSDVQAVGGDCDTDGIEIKLPSGKIDLNPRGSFQVVEGEALAIRLDMDARKSFQLHTAGNSGKCIFRPVIFVDIRSVAQVDDCPEVINGTVKLLENGSNGLTKEFVLQTNRGDLRVTADSSTVVFDENGNHDSDGSSIAVGKTAYVRGRLQPDGSLKASLVVVGEVFKIKGTAEGPVTGGQYSMSIDPYQELIGPSVDVKLQDRSLILIDCDTEVDASYIQEGTRTTVIGKYNTKDRVLIASVVFVEPRAITGRLTNIESVSGGSKLTVTPTSGSPAMVFLPDGQSVYLQGDGVVDLDRLKALYGCSNIQVRVLLDPAENTTPPTVKKIYVVPEQISGKVDSKGIQTIVLTDGTTVLVESGATIIRKAGASYVPIDLDTIKVGDDVTVFGLTDCTAAFYGYIIIVED
jgi:hypothetical protein